MYCISIKFILQLKMTFNRTNKGKRKGIWVLLPLSPSKGGVMAGEWSRQSGSAERPHRPQRLPAGQWRIASGDVRWKRRRAVESRGSACLCVSARLPYPYEIGLMVLGFWGSGKVSGKVRWVMDRLDSRGLWGCFWIRGELLNKMTQKHRET